MTPVSRDLRRIRSPSQRTTNRIFEFERRRFEEIAEGEGRAASPKTLAHHGRSGLPDSSTANVAAPETDVDAHDRGLETKSRGSVGNSETNLSGTSAVRPVAVNRMPDESLIFGGCDVASQTIMSAVDGETHSRTASFFSAISMRHFYLPKHENFKRRETNLGVFDFPFPIIS